MSPHRYITRRRRELNVLTREHPRRAAAWLDLAAFQHEAAVLKGDVSNPGRNKAVVETQVAILDNGLKQLPASVPLHLARLRAAARHMARDDVQRMWQDTLERMVAEPELWLAFLHFSMTHYSSFTVRARSMSVCDPGG